MSFRRRGLSKTLVLLFRVKVIAPMVRSKEKPEVIARGSLVGMAVAMTPLVGIQMYLTFMIWLGARKLFKWRFSLPVAIAWNWVTNVFTMPPIYYTFYLTGKLMTGSFEQRTGYAKFYGMIKNVMSEEGLWEATKALCAFLVKDWGVAMSIGCVPWMIVCSWASYVWTIRFLKHRRATLEKRLTEKQRRIERKIEKIGEKQERLEAKLIETVEELKEAVRSKEEGGS